MKQINEDTIALHWTTEDVMNQCDWLTKEQAREVLSMCLHQHDANPLCGDTIDLYLNIDDNKISEVKFDGHGCAICMACSSVLTEMIKGKSLEDVKKFDKDELLSELGLEHLVKTSPVRIKCALLSLKSLKFGIYSYFVDKMKEYGQLVGIAFQIQDDLLESLSNSDTMGKNLRSDLILRKKTFSHTWVVKIPTIS